MPLKINNISLIVFAVVILIFVLQYFNQLFYDKKSVFVTPIAIGKGGK